jgi:colanic acid/amylovoran biosynthesis glycosyltransferase
MPFNDVDSGRPPRVAYVVKRYPRFSETFIVNEILAHEAAGEELSIFSLLTPEDTHYQDVIARVRAPVTYLKAEGVRATEFWSAVGDAAGLIDGFWERMAIAEPEGARYVYQALKLAVEIRRRSIEHLHAHFATAATTVARMAAHLTGITYSFTAHAKDIFHVDVDRDDLRRKLADASHVITVSDYNVAHLRAIAPESAARIRRIYNGLGLEAFDYDEPAERARAILAVGRLVEKKGFDTLVDACALLRDRGSTFECGIVGAGELEPQLRARIALHRLEGIVTMAGALPQEDVKCELTSAAVLAVPCIIGADGNRDGLPTVLIEAMALGTPCVSTDVTGIPEIVRDGETGIIVPQRDPVALADALARLLDDADLRVRLARNARQLVVREFDVHRNAALVRECFGVAESAFQGEGVGGRAA